MTNTPDTAPEAVKRYDMAYGGQDTWMGECENGDFVYYDDYVALSAMLRACKGRVRVKPLEWEERRNGYWQAKGTGYQIAHNAHNETEVYRVRLGDRVIRSRIKGFESAKRWTFEHHSTRIIAALEPAPDHAECMHPFCGDRCGEQTKKGQTND